MTDEDFLIHRLTHSSHETVYSWLEHNASQRYYPQLEKELLNLRAPLITLGLGLFCEDPDVAHKIYHENDLILKKAALAGVSVGQGILEGWVEKTGLLKELIDSKNKELLLVFLRNKHILKETYINLFLRKLQFQNLDHELYLDLLNNAICNEIFPKWSQEETIECELNDLHHWDYHSGGIDEKYIIELSKACWNLFEELPTSPRAAEILSRIGENIVSVLPRKLLGGAFNVSKTAGRWDGTNAPESERNHYDACRTIIGTLVKGDFFKNHDNLSLRQSFYRKFKFESPEDLKPLLERDGDAFIEAASSNLWLYRNLQFREGLRECIRSHSSEYGKYSEYDHRFEAISKALPEWFLDNDGADGVDVDHISDPVLKQSYKLEHLRKKIENISANIEKTNELLSEELANNKRLIISLFSELKLIGWVIAGIYILANIRSIF